MWSFLEFRCRQWVNQMVIVLSVPQDLELSVLDNVCAIWDLALLHHKLIMPAPDFCSVLCQLFYLVHRETLEEWYLPEEIDFTIALLYLDFLEYSNVVISIKNCHTGTLQALHRFFSTRCRDVISFEGVLTKAASSFE